MIPAAVALGLTLLALIGRRLAVVRGAGRSGRLLGAAVALGAGVAVALVISAGLAAPFSPWDTVRLAPAMALLRGINPYAGAHSGAVLSTMYGPVAMIAYLPAALVRSPGLAAVVGRGLAFAFAFAPLAACCRPFERSEGREGRVAVLVLATLALLTSPALRYSGTFLHADAPALGLMGAACLLAARVETASLLGSSVLCVMAILTKQTLAPLPLALVGSAWWLGGPRRAARFAALLAGVSGVMAGIVLAVLDRDVLILNLVKIPGAVPWRGQAPGNVLSTAGEFLAHASPFLLALAAIACQGARHDARASTSARPRVFLLATVALVPMAILGRVKEAGDINSFSPALYPLLLATASLAASRSVREEARLRLCLATAILAMAFPGAARFAEEVRLLTKERPREAEAAYLTSHPDTVYFPWNPSVHLAVEGRPTHHLFSAWERGVAGFAVEGEQWRSGLPARAGYVAFPLKRMGPTVGFGGCLEMLERHGLLARPAVPVRLAGLPDYECYALTR